MTQNSTSAFLQHVAKIGTNKEKILETLKRYPNITRFSVGRITGMGHLEAQRRLSDLKNEGKVYESGSRKHGKNRISTYSLITQQSLFTTKHKTLKEFIQEEYPDIYSIWDTLYNHKL